jgi:four helix bundle protein
MMLKSHEDLDVWKLAIELADSAYDLGKTLPAEERFGLTSQIQRAAVSVAANIAEGSARDSTRDFLRYLSIAQGSLAEVQTLLIIARRRGFGSEELSVRIADQSSSVGRMLVALRNALRRKLERENASS